MGRAVLNPYRGFTKEAIKARASVPLQGDMAFVGNAVEASVDLYQIRDVLGISDLDFHGQATSPAVNPWSGFGPVQRRYSNAGSLNSTLINEVLFPDGIFEFAGYNHNAIAPGMVYTPVNMWVNQGESAQIDATVRIGEVIYPNALGVALAIFRDAIFDSAGIVDISIVDDEANLSCNTGSINIQTVFTGKVFITDSANSFDGNGGNVLCKVPNCIDFQVTINVRTASSFSASGVAPMTITGAACNFATGTVSFTNLYYDQDMTNLVVWAIVDVDGGDSMMYALYDYQTDGQYTAYTNIGARSHTFGAMGNMGYHVSIVAELGA